MKRLDCVILPRPCPRTECRYHLAEESKLDVGPSCALDVADRGHHTLEQIASLLGVTRERVRQIESIALRKMRRAAPRFHISADERDGLRAPGGPVTTWEACGCAVRVRSDKRGHVVQMRHGGRWVSLTNGERVIWDRTAAEAERTAERVLFGLVSDAYYSAQNVAWAARSVAKRQAAREAGFAAYEWLARTYRAKQRPGS